MYAILSLLYQLCAVSTLCVGTHGTFFLPSHFFNYCTVDAGESHNLLLCMVDRELNTRQVPPAPKSINRCTGACMGYAAGVATGYR